MTSHTKQTSLDDLTLRLNDAYTRMIQSLGGIPWDTARHLNAFFSSCLPGARPSLLGNASFERKLAQSEAALLGRFARRT